MRLTIASFFLAVSLIGCDANESAICLLGPETEIDGDITVHVRLPADGDTVRIGEPFRYVADVEATGEVSDVGIQIFEDGFGVLYERNLGLGEGTYTIDETVTLDSLPAAARLDSVYVSATGRVRVNTACGGGYDGAGVYLNPIYVLRPPAR